MIHRINIEAGFWTDPRMLKLAVKLGSEFTARGAFLTAIRLSQLFAQPESLLIPYDVWDAEGFPEAIFEVGLAVREEGGVYVRGAADHHEWIRRKREAGRVGGKKSAEKRAETYGSSRPFTRTSASSDVKHLRSTRSGENLLINVYGGKDPLTDKGGVSEAPTNECFTKHEAPTNECFVNREAKSNPLPLSLNTKIKERPRSPVGITPEGITLLIECWGETLRYLGSEKDPSFDQLTIARLVQRYGEERTRMALIGKRYEPSTKGFNAGDYLSISRLYNKAEIFEKLENLGFKASKRSSSPELKPVLIPEPKPLSEKAGAE